MLKHVESRRLETLTTTIATPSDECGKDSEEGAYILPHKVSLWARISIGPAGSFNNQLCEARLGYQDESPQSRLGAPGPESSASE